MRDVSVKSSDSVPARVDFSQYPLARCGQSADVLARDLLGRLLVRRLPGEQESLVLRIVETEAYLGAPDRASHAWNGRRTKRNEALYLPGGFAYVYFIYGMHFCFNVTAGNSENGEAVLVRAGEVIHGEERMIANRKLKREPPRPGDIAGGPAKICQALGIDRDVDGIALDSPELRIAKGRAVADSQVVCGPRVGIDYAGEAATWELRFAIREHADVSKPRMKN